MKSGGSNSVLRGRAAREDVGGGDSNTDTDALWELAIGGGGGDVDVDALSPLVPSAHWEYFGSKFDALGTSSPHLSISDCHHDHSPRPPSPVTREPPQPSLLSTLRSNRVAWGRTIKIDYVPQHHTCAGDAPPPPLAVHRRDDGDHVSMIGARRRTRKEEVADLGLQAPVGKVAKGKIGRWSRERYQKGLQKLLSVLQSRGATKDNPVKRSELLDAVRSDILDNGLRETLLGHITGQVLEGSTEKVCRQCDPLTGCYVYWLEGDEIAASPKKTTELTDAIISEINELKRLIMGVKGKEVAMEFKGFLMDLKARVDVLEKHVKVLADIHD